jgi:HAD superfamily hydrolase (TIGR01509 family)
VSAHERFDAVVFDNDGLLLETEGAWTRAEQRLFARFGREFTMDDKRAILGKAGPLAEQVLGELLERPGDGPQLFSDLEALAFEEIGRAAEPRPGAIELVERLRREGMPLGLASNSSRAFVDRALATAGVSRTLFAVTIAGDEVAHRKPAPDIYLAICEALGSEAARTAVLEDSPTGVAAAVAAGCFVIGVPSVEGVVLDDAALTVSSLALAPL